MAIAHRFGQRMAVAHWYGAGIPNSRNVIPGQVKFSIDFRNMTDALVDEMDAAIRAFAKQTERKPA